MVGARVASTIALLALAGPALAQQGDCTAAPPPPRNIRTKIDKAIQARGETPFTPAVLTLTWRPTDRVARANTAAAYLIESGSRPGVTDIAAVRTAGPEVSFTTPMADGTYHVRIRAVNACGEGPPSPETRIVVSGSIAPGLPNPLVILNTIQATRERLAGSAFVRIMGQVRNGWNAAPAAFVSVVASYEGTSGATGKTQTTLVTGTSGRLTHSGLVTDTVLEAGRTGCFVMFAQFNAAEVTGLGIVAAAHRVDVEPLPDQVTVEGAPTFAGDEFGDLVVSGRVSNGSTQATVRNEIWVEARDEAGRVLDCRGTPVAESAQALSSSQAVTFRNTTEAPLSTSRLVRWWATWEFTEASSGETPRYRELRDRLQRLLRDPAGAASEQIAQAREEFRREAESIERGARGQ